MSPVMTFSSILKYKSIPLAEMLQEILAAGHQVGLRIDLLP
jgi:hypothetical protein